MSDHKRKSDQIPFQLLSHLGTACVAIVAIGVVLVWLGKTTFSSNADLDALENKFNKQEKTYISEMGKINQVQAVQGVEITNIQKDVKEIKENGREVLRILQHRRR